MWQQARRRTAGCRFSCEVRAPARVLCEARSESINAYQYVSLGCSADASAAPGRGLRHKQTFQNHGSNERFVYTRSNSETIYMQCCFRTEIKSCSRASQLRGCASEPVAECARWDESFVPDPHNDAQPHACMSDSPWYLLPRVRARTCTLGAGVAVTPGHASCVAGRRG